MLKPDRLNALTGLRCFAAINIVLVHFSNPHWFGWLAPVVIRFYKARFTRLYPIYLLSLLMAWRMVPLEWGAHTHGMFWTGMVLSPLLLQGWIPEIATFLNTPAWTMSAESFYYLLFPWMASWKRPDRAAPHLLRMAVIWMLGLVPGTLYVIFNPDGLAHVDRFSWGPWLQALKYTPLPHMASFVFGVMLAELDEIVPRLGKLRLMLGLGGFAGTFSVLALAPGIPYAILHDGLLMPLFGCIILGLAGVNPLSMCLGCGRSFLWAKPATAFTCCTSISGAGFTTHIFSIAWD